MHGTTIKAALVSTNSITQGEQVAIMWKPLFEKGIHINFAHRTFRWDSEANLKAHVHCVIVGFSYQKQSENLLFLNETQVSNCKNINGYLVNAENVFIESRKKPLCSVPEMVFGSMPNDGGNLILSEEEYKDFIKNEPKAEKFIRFFLGAEEFINNKKRYCLWLVDANPMELTTMPEVMKRIEAVRKMRSESKREATNKLADYSHLFGEIRQPKEGEYLLIPRVSSENRRYVPMAFLDGNTIVSDAVQIVPEATLYEFGILTSNVHMAWMRAVCGRLKSDYRYSKDIVYNNFPWCNPTDAQRQKIEHTAQAILDARSKYPESSLADLYGETMYLFSDLLEAHRANDRAVMQAYGFPAKMTESECVAELFKLYEGLTGKK